MCSELSIWICVWIVFQSSNPVHTQLAGKLVVWTHWGITGYKKGICSNLLDENEMNRKHCERNLLWRKMKLKVFFRSRLVFFSSLWSPLAMWLGIKDNWVNLPPSLYSLSRHVDHSPFSHSHTCVHKSWIGRSSQTFLSSTLGLLYNQPHHLVSIKTSFIKFSCNDTYLHELSLHL